MGSSKIAVAMLAAVTTVAAMAYLTILGAVAGSPTEIDLKVAPQYERGKDVAGDKREHEDFFGVEAAFKF